MATVTISPLSPSMPAHASTSASPAAVTELLGGDVTSGSSDSSNCPLSAVPASLRLPASLLPDPLHCPSAVTSMSALAATAQAIAMSDLSPSASLQPTATATTSRTRPAALSTRASRASPLISGRSVGTRKSTRSQGLVSEARQSTSPSRANPAAVPPSALSSSTFPSLTTPRSTYSRSAPTPSTPYTHAMTARSSAEAVSVPPPSTAAFAVPGNASACQSSTSGDGIHPTFFKCEPCNRTFFTPVTYDKHMEGHSADRPYKCDLCPRTFNNRSNRHRHRTTHTDARPHVCAECGKSFKDPANLARHRRSHRPELGYKCSTCGRLFNDRGNMTRHERTHSGARPFTCDVCNRSFSDSYYLMSHRRIHSGETPFECTVCGKRFTNRSNHWRHMKIHSREAAAGALVNVVAATATIARSQAVLTAAAATAPSSNFTCEDDVDSKDPVSRRSLRSRHRPTPVYDGMPQTPNIRSQSATVAHVSLGDSDSRSDPALASGDVATSPGWRQACAQSGHRLSRARSSVEQVTYVSDGTPAGKISITIEAEHEDVMDYSTITIHPLSEAAGVSSPTVSSTGINRDDGDGDRVIIHPAAVFPAPCGSRRSLEFVNGEQRNFPDIFNCDECSSHFTTRVLLQYHKFQAHRPPTPSQEDLSPGNTTTSPAQHPPPSLSATAVCADGRGPSPRAGISAGVMAAAPDGDTSPADHDSGAGGALLRGGAGVASGITTWADRDTSVDCTSDAGAMRELFEERMRDSYIGHAALCRERNRSSFESRPCAVAADALALGYAQAQGDDGQQSADPESSPPLPVLGQSDNVSGVDDDGDCPPMPQLIPISSHCRQ